jgi:hypothetical protein
MGSFSLIENLGDTNSPPEMAQYRFLGGGRSNGAVALIPGPVPGNGDRWRINDNGSYVTIENLGDTNNPPEMAQYRFLGGGRSNGAVALIPGPVPGNGDRWRINDNGSYVTIENLGDTSNPPEMAQYRFLGGGRSNGAVALIPGPVPGNGDRWKISHYNISDRPDDPERGHGGQRGPDADRPSPPRGGGTGEGGPTNPGGVDNKGGPFDPPRK